MPTLIQHRQALYYRLRDIPDPTDITDRANARIPDSVYNLWVNRGIERIARDSLILQAEAILTSASSVNNFTLLGAGGTNLAADYYQLKGVDVNNSGIGGWSGNAYSQPTEVDISEIRRIFVKASGSLPTDVVPTKYAIFGGKIHFNKIVASGGILSGQYYKLPTTLSADGDTPDAPLDNWTSLVISASYLEFATDELDGQLLDASLKNYLTELEKLLKLYPRGSIGGIISEVQG